MKRTLLFTIRWCLLMVLPGSMLMGQDIHYSQFYHSPLNMNPALTGIFNGDLRFMGNFRDQWRSVPVPYTTFTAAFDTKLYPRRSDKYFWGLGINFNYDLAGTPSLNWLHLGVSGSFTYLLNQNNLITAGVQIAGAQRAFKLDNLTWDRQFTGLQFDPTLPSNENFQNTSFLYLDFSGGLNYRIQGNDQRSKLDLGVGYYHFNKPNQNFINGGDNPLPSRISLHGLGALKITNGIDILLNGTYQLQGPNSEIVAGLGGKFYLNQKRGKELALVAGVNWRVADAIIPTIEFHWKTWHLGLSYDFNYSDFRVATNRRGGPELSISYRILKVKPLAVYKTCPIY